MDLAGIKTKTGKALIEIDVHSSQVAWLNESIAPTRDISQMKAWVKNFHDKQQLTVDEEESLKKRALSSPKAVEPDFLFRLNMFCPILWQILDRLETESKPNE